MDRFHFSTASIYDNCPHRFKLIYLDELQTLPSDDPQNPLILGTAIHRAMETDLETAVAEYYGSFPVIDDRHINEVIKMEHWIPRMKELLPEGEHEVNFKNDVYEGTADLLVHVGSEFDEDGDEVPVCDLYDFKYSNNISHYMESEQLHVYRFYLWKCKRILVRKMYFVFVPKVMIRQGMKEDIQMFRKRLQEELEKNEVQIKEVPFNQEKVDDFHQTCMKIGLDHDYERFHTYLCDWCEFKDYCKKGIDYMILPKAERRSIGQVTKRKIWIFGGSFTGKTTVCDDAPAPLNLNTDGNIQFVTMPYVSIADQVKTEGRQTKTTRGWEVFKDSISELQKTAGQNGFKTIILDLTEDAYEMCRLYMYDKLGITHESDDSFRAWDKVRTEFFSTMREFFNLPYDNIVIISKEDMSRDITKKSGSKITQIKPNLQDKIATKLAGMVDIVVRTVVEDDGSYTMNFKADEVVFGGGRLKNISRTTIPTSWKELMKVYDEACGNVTTQEAQEDTSEDKVDNPKDDEEKPSRRAQKKQEKRFFRLDDGSVAMTGIDEEEPDNMVEEITEDEFNQALVAGEGQVAKRTRRTKKTEEAPAEEADQEETPAEEAPKRTRRRRTRG